MNPKLLKKYWAMWRDVKAKLMAGGAMTAIEADAMRDELCLKALGRVISSKDMTDDQCGDVLKEFQLILQPDNIDAQLEDTTTEGRKRAQCIWSIEREEKHPGYAQGICQDLHHRRDWKNLPYDQLLQLRRRIGNDAKGYTIPGGNTPKRRWAGKPAAAAKAEAPTSKRSPEMEEIGF